VRDIKVRTFSLNRNQYVKNKRYVYYEHTARFTAGLEWTINTQNAAFNGAAGYGDSLLSQDTIKCDGNLIFSSGYADGFGVRRIDDDGTISIVYQIERPANSYQYYPSLALDKKRKQVYIGNWVYDNLTRYTYSATESIADTKETLTEAGNNLPSDEVGYTFCSGLEVVGDYLYIIPDDKVTGTDIFRWHIPSETADNIPIRNGEYTTGRYGHAWYDSRHNRVYMNFRTDAGVHVVLNPERSSSLAEGAPSTEPTAAAFCLRQRSLVGSTNDMYTYASVADNGDPNKLIVGGYYGRYAYGDASAIINSTGTAMSLIDGPARRTTTNQDRPFLLQAEGIMIMPHPTWGSEMPLVKSAADWGGANWGWLDRENWLIIWPHRQYADAVEKGISTVTCSRSENQLDFTYAPVPRKEWNKATAGNGKQYWVLGGYTGADGGKMWAYDADDHPNCLELRTAGFIEFGDFQFSDLRNITSIQITNFRNDVYRPTDTKFRVFVSNDGGSNYIEYGWKQEEIKLFRSLGNKARVKFNFFGNGKRGAYIYGLNAPMVTIRGEDYGERDAARNYTLTTIKGI